MRNKYSQEFEKEMKKLAPRKTLEELLEIARTKYNYSITEHQLRLYLSKRQIRYKNYKESHVREMGNNIPIGTEYVKADGMTLIKVASNKWKYKQRYIYEQYYGVELQSYDYIIFLNQNRNDFRIENLKKISREESSVLSNQKMFSKNPKITTLGIETAKLMIKIKEKNVWQTFLFLLFSIWDIRTHIKISEPV